MMYIPWLISGRARFNLYVDSVWHYHNRELLTLEKFIKENLAAIHESEES